jgi:hypothetical protein
VLAVLGPWLTIVPALSVIVAVVVGARQVRNNSRQRELAALQRVFEDMVSDERNERRTRVLRNSKELSAWTAQEIRDAERELERFQQLGFFVRHGFLRRKLILQMYSLVTIQMWNAVRSFVHQERSEMGAPAFAADFERLARECERFRIKKRWPIDGQIARRPAAGAVGLAGTDC